MSEPAILVSIAVLLVGILTSSIVGVYAILVRLGKLETIVGNGLVGRVGRSEEWIAWLVKDRMADATRTGTTQTEPLPDTAEIEQVLP
jgi:hypothetical protein